MTDSRRPDPDVVAAETDQEKAPLTVLIGTDTFPPDVNGAARFGEHLAAGLAARGHHVHVIAPAQTRKTGTWTETYDGQAVTMHRIRSYRWYPHPWLRFMLPWTIKRKIAKILDNIEPDVVHFQSHFVVGRGLTVEARKRGIRIIATNHTMPENLLDFTVVIPRRLQKWAMGLAWKDTNRILSRAAAVTTPTRKAAQYLEAHTTLRQVYAISCGIDASNYTPDFSPRTGNRVVFVGRVSPEKQIDVLIRAMALLPESLDATLEVVGGGDQLKNLESLARSLGLADRVSFTGYVTEEELRAAYTRATVLGMPSTAELQSIVTMEAMASALPVVAANAMALPHLVHDGENGYLFEPGNANAMAERLTKILTATPEELTAMKNASLRLIAAHDIQRTLTTFEKLYRGEPVSDPVMDPASSVGQQQPARGGSSAG